MWTGSATRGCQQSHLWSPTLVWPGLDWHSMGSPKEASFLGLHGGHRDGHWAEDTMTPPWTVSRRRHGKASSKPFPRKIQVPSTLGCRFLMFQTPGALTPLYAVHTVYVTYVSHVFFLFNYEADGPVPFLPILPFPHPQQRTLYRVTFDRL